MLGFSQAERELLQFIQSCDGSVSRKQLVEEGPVSDEEVDELLLGLEDYLRTDQVERSGERVRMYDVVDSVPECSACSRLLAFEEVQEFDGVMYCQRHYRDAVGNEMEERKMELRKMQDQREKELQRRKEELENLEPDIEEWGVEVSELEHREVEKIIGVEPGEGSVETVRDKWGTEDGDLFTLVVKKRLQCPSCGRIMVEDPVAPGSCPECGEGLGD